jgi:SAM-dependent methyltransferase
MAMDLDQFLAGEKLFGDDFDAGQIQTWYREEEEGYANLGAKDRSQYRYEYRAWNERNAFRFLPPNIKFRTLGFGSAYGDELEPILDQISLLTIVDPSAAFVHGQVHNVPVQYVKPSATGAQPFADSSFDLITCFGVLHHIPNVSYVLSELARVLSRGGYLLIREPIVSMGDWRFPRPGLTRNERGIPLRILRQIVAATGLATVSCVARGFAPIEKVASIAKIDLYNSSALVAVDALISNMFSWNDRYHATTVFQRIRPTSAFLVLCKT